MTTENSKKGRGTDQVYDYVSYSSLDPLLPSCWVAAAAAVSSSEAGSWLLTCLPSLAESWASILTS